MSKADELLNSLVADSGISVQLADPTTEPHIVIGNDRFISVPAELQRIAVQYDHDVETVTFDCPRYWDDLDMSQLRIYINYMRKDRVTGCYLARNITVDDTDPTIMHFDWTISRNVSLIKGELKFLVCIKKGDADGNEVNHWNSELNTEMYISEGLEVSETFLDPYPDIILQWEEDVQRVKDILLAARDSGEFDGATFTPSVDDDGNLSWMNDKGKANPTTKNIKGYSPRILVREVDGGKEFVITDYSGSQTVKVSDGYSPRILVREVDGGKQLIITDSSGSQTVEILNGTNGTDGYSPVILVREIDGGRELIITDSRQSQTVAIKDGTDGKDGTNGTDGVSPTISVSTITGGHRVTITDKDGTKTFDVKDGINTTETGSDGVSPTVSVVDITGGHRVTITDVDGAKTFDVMDGQVGATGPTGENGYSPRILVREIEGGKQLVITDYTGSQTVTINDGTDGAIGADGYSPIVAIADISGGHRVTITDKDGAKSFDVMDGEGGSTDGTPVYIGDIEPTSGPVLWFDTSSSAGGN